MTKIKSLDYLDKIINIHYSDDEFFMNYYRLTDHLRAINFDASFPNCLMLFNNNLKILRLVKHIVENNIDDILAGSFTKFTKDLMLINLIKAYCFSNEIKYREKNIVIKHIDSPILAAKEEIALFRLWAKGNKDAKDIIILKNLNLVRYFAYKIADKYEIKDPNLIDDMISTGTIGLFKAINNFSLEAGVKFSTYASKYVINEITVFLRCNNSVISKPKARADQQNKLNRQINDLAVTLGRYPTKIELADYLGISIDNLEKFEKKRVEVEDAYQDVNGEQINILDNTKSCDAIDQDMEVIELSELFDRCKLTQIQKRNLEAYCFFNQGFKEIGDTYGVTKQAINISINNAIAKIQKTKEGNDFINGIIGQRTYGQQDSQCNLSRKIR